MERKIKKQILAIRNTGLTNMFDVNTVQKLAFEYGSLELIGFLEEHRETYVNFIIYGADKNL